MNSFLRCLAAACFMAVVVEMTPLVIAGPKPPEPPPLEKPKPPPANVSSSESLPPLPLPVVAMKRQEKKNPPVPPVLLTKIRTADPEDWARTPNDLRGLLAWMSSEMNVNFSSNIKTFGEINPGAADNPVVYRTGYKSFELNPREAANLRNYVLSGGTIIFNALVGHPDFYQSALKAAQEILPESPVYRLRPDHPIFHSFYDVGKVAYRERMQRDSVGTDPYPYLDGVDIENRTAIIISRWDLSLGWEANKWESWGYSDADARRIGANIISYATAMKDAGRSVGKSVQLVNSDRQNASKFRVGQIIHEGPWKTRVAAFPMLLNAFHEVTGTPVSFDLSDVRLTDSAIFTMPFLYLTGTTDFQFSEAERANLRRFLSNGGVLFAEAGEGRPSFDAALRAELAQVLPGRKLEALPKTHVLYQQPSKVDSVKVRPALAALRGNQLQQAPELHGIELNGSLAVIYCPFDLSSGWERALAPYAVGYESADATALGVNVLFHSVAH